ncbi:MAG: signal peptidase I [Saccharofermentans sp.]|nr:signal peptidase I [Saccharofermentans sp.]
MADNKQEKEASTLSFKIMTIVGIILCIILVPILIVNITLIVRSYSNPGKVPNFGSVVPLIVLTDSMYPNIQSGDLIICDTLEAEEVNEGDVIAFFDPAGNGSSVVTHRVIEVTTENGAIAWRTQGDANNTPDSSLVPADNLVGRYKLRIAGAGNVAMFMQTTQGLIVCVVLPIILLVGYDYIRRKLYEKAQKEDTDALLKELAELRSKAGEKDSADN